MRNFSQHASGMRVKDPCSSIPQSDPGRNATGVEVPPSCLPFRLRFLGFESSRADSGEDVPECWRSMPHQERH